MRGLYASSPRTQESLRSYLDLRYAEYTNSFWDTRIHRHGCDLASLKVVCSQIAELRLYQPLKILDLDACALYGTYWTFLFVFLLRAIAILFSAQQIDYWDERNWNTEWNWIWASLIWIFPCWLLWVNNFAGRRIDSVQGGWALHLRCTKERERARAETYLFFVKSASRLPTDARAHTQYAYAWQMPLHLC